MPTLAELNAASAPAFTDLLDGVYEHSPWIAARTWAARPFATLAALKAALVQTVRQASRDEQLGLMRAHPELAGKAAVAGQLTAESTDEQSRAGLSHCTPEEFDRITALNATYTARFGWPFILAVRGPRGAGLSRTQIIATLERRSDNPPDFEFAEALRQIHRAAELRLNDKFGVIPEQGNRVWDWCEQLAQYSEPDWKARGELTTTYLTDAHRAGGHALQQCSHNTPHSACPD